MKSVLFKLAATLSIALLVFEVRCAAPSRPIRVGLLFQIGADPVYDCFNTTQFVKLGQPGTDNYEVLPCSSQDLRNPFTKIGQDQDCWHRCGHADVVDNGTRAFVETTVSNVVAEFQDKLHILWATDRVAVAKAPASPSDASPSTRAGDLNVCPYINQALTSALPGAALSTDNARDRSAGDLRVYVTVRPNPAKAPGATTICHRDGYGRPVIAHINIDAARAARLYANSLTPLAGPAKSDVRPTPTSAAALMRNIVRHEMMHALAMTWNSVSQFRTLSRQLRQNVVQDGEARGVSVMFLALPRPRYQVRRHFRIDVRAAGLPGLEITGIDSLQIRAGERLPPLNEVHLSPQVARSDVASPVVDGQSVLSNFSLSVLADTGWYLPDLTKAEPISWGRGQGADYLRSVPQTNATVQRPHNCEVGAASTQLACSYNPVFKGFCQPGDAGPNVVPAALSSFVQPDYVIGNCSRGALTEEFRGSGAVVEQFGDKARCFDVSFGPASRREAVCLTAECVDDGVLLDINGEVVVCPFDGEVAVPLAGSATETASIPCPSVRAACPEQAPEPVCPGNCNDHGVCCNDSPDCLGDNGPVRCHCEPGWDSRPDCSEYRCDGDKCLVGQEVQTVLEAEGTCTAEGQCKCDAGFTGVDCRTPVTQCGVDCSFLGLGYHCIGNLCEKQCSINGRKCVPVDEVVPFVRECEASFKTARTKRLCIPDGDLATVARGLYTKFRRELTRLTPTLDNNPRARGQECRAAVNMLACFTTFRECKGVDEDFELQLCKRSCDVYNFECGQAEDCKTGDYRDTHNSEECSGSAQARDYLTKTRLILYVAFGVIGLVILALLICVSRIWLADGRAPLCLSYLPLWFRRRPGGSTTSSPMHSALSGRALHDGGSPARVDAPLMFGCLPAPRWRAPGWDGAAVGAPLGSGTLRVAAEPGSNGGMVVPASRRASHFPSTTDSLPGHSASLGLQHMPTGNSSLSSHAMAGLDPARSGPAPALACPVRPEPVRVLLGAHESLGRHMMSAFADDGQADQQGWMRSMTHDWASHTSRGWEPRAGRPRSRSESGEDVAMPLRMGQQAASSHASREASRSRASREASHSRALSPYNSGVEAPGGDKLGLMSSSSYASRSRPLSQRYSDPPEDTAVKHSSGEGLATPHVSGGHPLVGGLSNTHTTTASSAHGSSRSAVDRLLSGQAAAVQQMSRGRLPGMRVVRKQRVGNTPSLTNSTPSHADAATAESNSISSSRLPSQRPPSYSMSDAAQLPDGVPRHVSSGAMTSQPSTTPPDAVPLEPLQPVPEPLPVVLEPLLEPLQRRSPPPAPGRDWLGALNGLGNAALAPAAPPLAASPPTATSGPVQAAAPLGAPAAACRPRTLEDLPSIVDRLRASSELTHASRPTTPTHAALLAGLAPPAPLHALGHGFAHPHTPADPDPFLDDSGSSDLEPDRPRGATGALPGGPGSGLLSTTTELGGTSTVSSISLQPPSPGTSVGPAGSSPLHQFGLHGRTGTPSSNSSSVELPNARAPASAPFGADAPVGGLQRTYSDPFLADSANASGPSPGHSASTTARPYSAEPGASGSNGHWSGHALHGSARGRGSRRGPMRELLLGRASAVSRQSRGLDSGGGASHTQHWIPGPSSVASHKPSGSEGSDPFLDDD